MPPLIVPDSFVVLLAAFQPCFTAPTFRSFRYLVAGWVQCPGRHTVTAVVLALWVPLPFGPQGRAKGMAIPVLFRLYVGSRRGNRADAAGGGRR